MLQYKLINHHQEPNLLLFEFGRIAACAPLGTTDPAVLLRVCSATPPLPPATVPPLAARVCTRPPPLPDAIAAPPRACTTPLGIAAAPDGAPLVNTTSWVGPLPPPKALMLAPGGGGGPCCLMNKGGMREPPVLTTSPVRKEFYFYEQTFFIIHFVCQSLTGPFKGNMSILKLL